MRNTTCRLRRAAAKLALVATSAVIFQAAGCSAELSDALAASAEEVTRVFVNTMITTFVSDQLGVQNALTF